jgi:hypothetical protein
VMARLQNTGGMVREEVNYGSCSLSIFIAFLLAAGMASLCTPARSAVVRFPDPV